MSIRDFFRPDEVAPFMSRLSLVVVTLMSLLATETNAQTVIYGSMVNNNSWGTWDRYEGIYSFTPTEGTVITPVYIDGYDLGATAGGVLVNDEYHLFNKRNSSSSWLSVNYTSFKINDWSITNSCYFSDVITSNDMTYDLVTDRVYCAQKSGNQGKLVLWNPSNIDQVNDIASLSVEILVIAADAQGELYGVGKDGVFYKIGKTDGQLTSIGVTGIMPKGNQSAVFDYNSGKLYWAAYTTDNKSSLYEIDVTTGHATKITDFANNAQFCGLYIIGSNTAEAAPGAVTNLKVTFPSGSNDGNITFKMPTTTYGNSPLSGTLNYRVYMDEQLLFSGSAQPGDGVSRDLTVATGSHEFVVIASNAHGDSPRVKESVYVGKGVPGYVDYPTALPTGVANQVVLSWEAPTYCVPLDAYFDPAELRYKVVRLPDNVVVAENLQECTLTDNIDYDGPLKIYKYSITSFIDNLSSESVETNGVAIGNPLVPPFEAQMATTDLDFFTIIDANHDGSTWVKDWYGYGVGCGGRWDGDCDDWLILPPLHLENSGVYRVIMNVGHDYDGPSKWELKIGTTPTPEGMTTTLLAPTSTTDSFDNDISVAETGTYYIGIHCIGSAGKTMYVADVIVRGQTNNNAPDAPTKLSGIGADKGELSAYITFTTPTKTIGGDELTSITGVNIYRGEKLVHTLTDVTVNTEYTCKVPAEQEFNEYSVAAVNEQGEGRRAKIEYVFAGLDYPAMIETVTLSETEDGQPHLTWDSATDTGLYGYYVNPEEVRYEIYRGYGNDEYDLIEESFDGTEYIDNNLDKDCDQFILTYYIYPVNTIGRSYGTASNSECFGRPYTTPFVETFPDGIPQMTPWFYRSSDPQTTGWSIYKNSDTTIEDFDGSNGMMAFYSSSSGNEATLSAPFVTVKGMNNPVLDFYYYMDNLVVIPKVKVNGDNLYNEDDTDTNKGWHHFAASLAGYNGLDRLKITFECASETESAYAFIDNIRVREQYRNDLALAVLNVPEELTLGEETTVKVTVRNDGTDDSTGATLTLYRNGYAVEQTELAPIVAGRQTTIEFKQIPDVSYGEKAVYAAEVTYEADEDSSNDKSQKVTANLNLPRYPTPTDLKGEATESGVSLSWNAPTSTTLIPDPIVEDFESYEPFAIEMSPWTLVDGDKQPTAVMSNPDEWWENLQYPHSGEPTAYQIFDPSAAGIDTSLWYNYAPHSGNKAAVCWPSEDWSIANDDWLISTELFPAAQTISFYVYTRNGLFGNEKYEVLYSSTDKNVDSFTLLMEGTADNEWTKVTVDLPADAKYFAIHTVSVQSYSEIWFDDISYVPAALQAIQLDLKGYNIYRDNMRINGNLVEEPSYIDSEATAGKHKYNVTAVYGVGESKLSESAYVDNGSGIVAPSAAATFNVVGGTGRIMIGGAEGHSFTIYNVNGMAMFSSQAKSQCQNVAIAPGIYVVNIEGNAFKVMVR